MSQCQGQQWKPGLLVVCLSGQPKWRFRREARSDRYTLRRDSSGGFTAGPEPPREGASLSAPDLPARRTPTCLEVSAVMPRTRPPSREEKDALAAVGPPTDWFCRNSPGSAVSVFSTMSLIAAARDPVATRPHARPLTRRRPGLRRHFLFVWRRDLYSRPARTSTVFFSETPLEGARVREEKTALQACADVVVLGWRRTEELMLLNCSVGEDSWESLGLQGDPTSPS